MLLPLTCGVPSRRLTPERIDVLEEGRETDILVARAIGLGDSIRDGLAVQIRGDVVVPFRASADWNDAMEAAARFGLFSSLHRLLLRQWDIAGAEDWWVSYAESDNAGRDVARARTGPLAICRAILKLSIR